MKTKLPLLLTAVITLSSCGDLRKLRPLADLRVIRGLESQNTRKLLSSEIVIGKRICKSFKEKKELLDSIIEANSKGEKRRLRFYAEVQDCKNTEIIDKSEFNVSPKLVGTTYEYAADLRPASDYISEVISNENGHMKVFCERFDDDQNVEKQNHYLSEGATYIASFAVIDSYDQLKIVKKVADVITEAETIMFITQDVNDNAKYFGIEKDRSQYILCPDKKNTSYIKQTWREEIILP
jgi:hypothetical protein